MFHAPFRISDGSFYLAEHLLGNRADCLAQFRRGCGRVPVHDLLKILPQKLRFQSASGLDDSRDACRRCFSEGRPRRKIIVLR
jgi:hypothetical protein